MKNYFHKPGLNESAPWIDLLIELFKGDNSIDLHIVAPNIYINRNIYMRKDGVSYHFYRYRSRFYPLKIHNLKKRIFPHHFVFIKNRVFRIIDRIQPDLIHLHGAENPYYSAAILPLLSKYPVFLTIQGFIRHATISNREIRAKINIEEQIIRAVKYVGTRTKAMTESVRIINPDAKIFFHTYPSKIPKCVKDNHGRGETIDCIFFARVCKDKGIEDLLEAISIIKKRGRMISLYIIGEAGRSYSLFLEKICIDLNIKENVRFLGFLQQELIYQYALKSKICVLPTYHDILPGTIIESMNMKLPVVTYAVDGMAELNFNEKVFILIEKNNIEHLANSIIELLEDVEKRKEIAENAFLVANKHLNNNMVKHDIINAYKSIMCGLDYKETTK